MKSNTNKQPDRIDSLVGVAFIISNARRSLVLEVASCFPKVLVAFDTVLRSRIPGDQDALASRDVVDNTDPSARLRSAVSIGNNVDIRNVVWNKEVVAFNLKAINTAAFVNGQVAVALVVDDPTVEDITIAMILVHEAFSIIDEIASIRAPIPMDLEVIVLDLPAPTSHFNRAIVIRR